MTCKTGTSMQAHRVSVRFEKCAAGGAHHKLTRDDIPNVRRLLRTGKSQKAIAEALGVTEPTIVKFIRRYRLCDMKMRRTCISSSKLEPIA